MTILDFAEYKKTNKKISMVTCYDYWSARILDESNIDCILVGDSLAQIMHGHDSTLKADVDVMALHTAAVARGVKNKFIVADMPFLSVQKGLKESMDNVEKLMKAGAHAVKIENVQGHSDVIRAIIDAGVPVMGHLGLTPQSVFQLGGYKVQGREESQQKSIMYHAKQLEGLGCFAVVLECIPSPLAKTLTQELQISTIGIGAGADTDGQVLVMHDLLGLTKGHKPKFLKNYLAGNSMLIESINIFDREVKNKQYPTEAESYT